ncbi:glutaredoxin 3 [Episyrphus balteatus]|uniref:glutaredoxin 3 n=1 Tax=Episyrphus balteatus TaxID=286459 RepID=UPI0024851754|nr:glutaredoxin 3 [Episyrphus balteatus]
MSVIEIKTEEEYTKLIGSEKTSVVLFSAPWAEQCKQVEDVLTEISNLGYTNLQFASLNAESFPEISMKHQIEAVPTIIFFTKGQAVNRVDGVNVASINQICKDLGSKSGAGSGASLEDRLKALINKSDVMIFMKGSRDAPKCGFSKQLIAIVNEIGIQYGTFDILTDEEVRQGLKTYSDWPTYPQLYVKGELIGGLDIIKELLASGELESTLKAA